MFYGYGSDGKVLLQFPAENFMNILEPKKPIIACLPEGALKNAALNTRLHLLPSLII